MCIYKYIQASRCMTTRRSRRSASSANAPREKVAGRGSHGFIFRRRLSSTTVYCPCFSSDFLLMFQYFLTFGEKSPRKLKPWPVGAGSPWELSGIPLWGPPMCNCSLLRMTLACPCFIYLGVFYVVLCNEIIERGFVF